MKPTFAFAWTLFVAVQLASCSGRPALEIAVSNRPPPNQPNLVVINRSHSEIQYVPGAFDHALDVWHLSGVPSLRGREIGAFVVFAIDEKGIRHLRCGSKDGPTPSPELYTLRLGPEEKYSVKLPDPESFRLCLPDREKKLYWQVVYVRVSIERNVKLSEPEDFNEIYQSNLIAFPPSSKIDKASIADKLER